MSPFTGDALVTCLQLSRPGAEEQGLMETYAGLLFVREEDVLQAAGNVVLYVPYSGVISLSHIRCIIKLQLYWECSKPKQSINSEVQIS